MKAIAADTMELLWHDGDRREAYLRQVIEERLAANPPPAMADHVVASYFFAFRTQRLEQAVAEISYHATSGVKHPPPGSLLAQCSAQPAGVDAFDETGRLGLLHVAFPLKMMLQPDGHLTSCDLLHTTAAAIIFDVYENQDARLLRLQIPDRVVRTFPGPAYGPAGIRQAAGLAPGQPAFGTILKPTAGITPAEVEQLVADVASCPLFIFVKEDEDLYPRLDYSPVAERTRLAMAAIARSREQRQGKELLFAPHISGAPHEILDTVSAVLEAGATALMFSESFAGGTVRMVREHTRGLARPPMIYGHNAGIGVRTGGIWREVIDMLARLDGIDFRQTAPLRPGVPFLRPYGAELAASEAALSRPMAGILPTMLVRAGALDQGNIGLNLADAEAHGLGDNILFLAGSAINSIKGADGKPEARIGIEAMLQAIEIHRSGEISAAPAHEHLAALTAAAQGRQMTALVEALRQRYPNGVG